LFSAAQRSFFADVTEVDPERAQLAVEVRALHPHPLGELSHLAVTEQELLLEIGPFELLARLAQGQGEQVLLDERLPRRGLNGQLALDFLQPDLLRAALDQEA